MEGQKDMSLIGGREQRDTNPIRGEARQAGTP
jgi:hypothetical protein